MGAREAMEITYKPAVNGVESEEERAFALSEGPLRQRPTMSRSMKWGAPVRVKGERAVPGCLRLPHQWGEGAETDKEQQRTLGPGGAGPGARRGLAARADEGTAMAVEGQRGPATAAAALQNQLIKEMAREGAGRISS